MIINFFKIIRTIISHPLSRSRKTLAIISFLRFQVGNRLLKGKLIYDWINNSKFIASTGETGITGNIYLGLHEFTDMGFLLHVLRERDLFVDIGANVGSYTILGSAAIGARTVCFEPVPSTYKRLKDNIRINNIGSKVESLNIALGNSKGEVYFLSDQNCKNHVIANNETKKENITVSISTLDKELKDCPFLIKIDVEGFELPVLEGGNRILSNMELCGVIIELNGSGNRYGYDDSSILNIMSSHGFTPFEYNPLLRRMIKINGKNKEGGNTIFIRDVDRIERRIKGAPLIKVFDLEI
jgi:FkbM family methyltransferase